MLSVRTHHCSQARLGFRRAFCQNFGSTSIQRCRALPSPTHIRRSVAGHAAGQSRRATLTTLLGSTVLAMGFGTSAMAASASSTTVETVGNAGTDSVLKEPGTQMLHACIFGITGAGNVRCRFCKIPTFLNLSPLAQKTSNAMMRPQTHPFIPSHGL